VAVDEGAGAPTSVARRPVAGNGCARHLTKVGGGWPSRGNTWRPTNATARGQAGRPPKRGRARPHGSPSVVGPCLPAWSVSPAQLERGAEARPVPVLPESFALAASRHEYPEPAPRAPVQPDHLAGGGRRRGTCPVWFHPPGSSPIRTVKPPRCRPLDERQGPGQASAFPLLPEAAVGKAGAGPKSHPREEIAGLTEGP